MATAEVFTSHSDYFARIGFDEALISNCIDSQDIGAEHTAKSKPSSPGKAAVRTAARGRSSRTDDMVDLTSDNSDDEGTVANPVKVEGVEDGTLGRLYNLFLAQVIVSSNEYWDLYNHIGSVLDFDESDRHYLQDVVSDTSFNRVIRHVRDKEMWLRSCIAATCHFPYLSEMYSGNAAEHSLNARIAAVCLFNEAAQRSRGVIVVYRHTNKFGILYPSADDDKLYVLSNSLRARTRVENIQDSLVEGLYGVRAETFEQVVLANYEGRYDRHASNMKVWSYRDIHPVALSKIELVDIRHMRKTWLRAGRERTIGYPPSVDGLVEKQVQPGIPNHDFEIAFVVNKLSNPQDVVSHPTDHSPALCVITRPCIFVRDNGLSVTIQGELTWPPDQLQDDGDTRECSRFSDVIPAVRHTMVNVLPYEIVAVARRIDINANTLCDLLGHTTLGILSSAPSLSRSSTSSRSSLPSAATAPSASSSLPQSYDGRPSVREVAAIALPAQALTAATSQLMDTAVSVTASAIHNVEDAITTATSAISSFINPTGPTGDLLLPGGHEMNAQSLPAASDQQTEDPGKHDSSAVPSRQQKMPLAQKEELSRLRAVRDIDRDAYSVKQHLIYPGELLKLLPSESVITKEIAKHASPRDNKRYYVIQLKESLDSGSDEHKYTVILDTENMSLSMCTCMSFYFNNMRYDMLRCKHIYYVAMHEKLIDRTTSLVPGPASLSIHEQKHAELATLTSGISVTTSPPHPPLSTAVKPMLFDLTAAQLRTNEDQSCHFNAMTVALYASMMRCIWGRLMLETAHVSDPKTIHDCIYNYLRTMHKGKATQALMRQTRIRCQEIRDSLCNKTLPSPKCDGMASVSDWIKVIDGDGLSFVETKAYKCPVHGYRERCMQRTVLTSSRASPADALWEVFHDQLTDPCKYCIEPLSFDEEGHADEYCSTVLEQSSVRVDHIPPILFIENDDPTHSFTVDCTDTDQNVNFKYNGRSYVYYLAACIQHLPFHWVTHYPDARGWIKYDDISKSRLTRDSGAVEKLQVQAVLFTYVSDNEATMS